MKIRYLLIWQEGYYSNLRKGTATVKNGYQPIMLVHVRKHRVESDKLPIVLSEIAWEKVMKFIACLLPRVPKVLQNKAGPAESPTISTTQLYTERWCMSVPWSLTLPTTELSQPFQEQPTMYLRNTYTSVVPELFAISPRNILWPETMCRPITSGGQCVGPFMEN